MKWKGMAVGLLGLFLALTPFWSFSSRTELAIDLIAGIIIAAIGFSMIKSDPIPGWIVEILGAWLAILILIPPLHICSLLYLNNVIGGTIVMVAGMNANLQQEGEGGTSNVTRGKKDRLSG